MVIRTQNLPAQKDLQVWLFFEHKFLPQLAQIESACSFCFG